MLIRCLFTFSAVVGLVLVSNAASGAVVVDNDAGPPAYVESGSWSTSGSTGYDGGTYRFTSVGNASTATWTADLPTAGDCEVFVWYVPGSNRATSTKYDIVAADGTHTAYINQAGGGYTWESLGTFSFSAGSHSITLDAANSSGGSVVIADAVRFGGESGGECTVDSSAEIAPGVTHTAYTCPAPLAIHVLEFDLADPQFTIDLGFAHGKRNFGGLETVPQIAAHYDTADNDVIGAVNGGYFESGLAIHGMLGTGGNLISTRDDTWWCQQTYMLQQNGAGWAGSDLVGATMTARFADQAEIPIDILDLPCSAGAINLYTPDWDTSTRSISQGVEILVENVNYPLRPNKEVVGTITAIQTGAASVNNPIPSDGFVLAACSDAEAELLAHAVVGDQLSVRFDMPTAEMVNMKTLCTGNAWMVKDGVPFHGGGPERHPRTVLAWSGTRHWFVTFDGRQPGYSVGANVEEMQDFLIDTLHVDNAINLDGGGSTTMLVDGSVVNCPSDGATTPCTGTPRAVPNALLLVQRDATTRSPLSDPFGADGRSLAWDDKFGFNPVVPLAFPAPGGDGFVLEVLNDDGAYETTSVGEAGDHDCSVEALILCEYRPEVAADGFERVGIFARDDGNANFETDVLGGGNCYALTFDTDTGRIRAGVVINGVFTDFLEATPLYEPSNAWRRLRIECCGDEIRYKVNGTVIADVIDATRATGRFGIGHHEYFATDANVRGTRAENFSTLCVDFDFDNDGDVDVVDFGPFAFCMQGPAMTYAPGTFCAGEDGDGDLDVDVVDFQIFQWQFTGP